MVWALFNTRYHCTHAAFVLERIRRRGGPLGGGAGGVRHKACHTHWHGVLTAARTTSVTLPGTGAGTN